MMYRGSIVEALPNHRAWVKVPVLAGQDPLDVPVVPYDLSPGEGVLVGDLGGRGLDLVVIGRERELQRFPEWGELVGVPAEFPPAPHGHGWGEISGKPASFPPSTHGHTWGEISGTPATYPPSAHSHTWDSVTGKPVVFPPTGHVHGVSDISDSTTIGRSLVTAQTAVSARTAIGAMDAARTFTKTDVGLGSVDNTADLDKPVSNLTAAALGAKAPLPGARAAVVLATGYQNYNDAYATPACWIDGDYVHFEGTIGCVATTISHTGGTIYSLASLPTGIPAPDKSRLFNPAMAHAFPGSTNLYVNADGTIKYMSEGSTTNVARNVFYISLDGVYYRTGA